MAKKVIPPIHASIQEESGSVAWTWYLFFQWLADNAGKVDLSDYFTKEETEELLSAKVDADDLKAVAFTGDYDDLNNTPTIPTVNNATITIKQGGVTMGSFTINQSEDEDIDLDQGGADVDNITVSMNSDSELQAIGVINRNTATGAENPIYDWVGTEAEYEAQNIATLHPEWLCFITDDCESVLPIKKEVSERNIGEIVYSSIPITDSGLHLLDGTLLDGTGIYLDFYEYMVSVYNAGHTSIFCSESAWQTSNTNYGKCGKFVLNTTNHTIRLPKVTGFVEGTLIESEIGNRVAPGLPNIAGKTGLSLGGSPTDIISAPFYVDNNGSAILGSSTSSSYRNIKYNAALSNSIYGASSTVQPESVKFFVYIVIANADKTPVQVNIDNIATELNSCYAHRVVEFQAPTAQNNYTWYRKYADGWVEQGGRTTHAANTGNNDTVTLPIAMQDLNYCVQVSSGRYDGNNDSAKGIGFSIINTSSIIVSTYTPSGWTSQSTTFSWEVKGMAA